MKIVIFLINLFLINLFLINLFLINLFLFLFSKYISIIEIQKMIYKYFILFTITFLNFNIFESIRAKSITNYFKKYLTQTSNSDIQTLIYSHYQKISNNDIIIHDLLLKLSHDKSINDLSNMLDKISDNLEKNSYMTRVLDNFSNKDIQEVYNKVISTPKEQILNLLTLALCIEDMNIALGKDIYLFEKIYNVWDKKSKDPLNIYQKNNLFFLIKYYSIKKPIDKFFIYAKNKKINKNFGKILLPMNIIEAVLEDLRKGNINNSFAGFILATCSLIQKVSLSFDCQKFLVFFNYGKEWSDLYIVWNLAFVSNFGAFWYIKLLIPSVSNYYNNPEEFLFNRVIALYISLNIALLFDSPKDQELIYLDWTNNNIKNIFGKINILNAIEFKKLMF